MTVIKLMVTVVVGHGALVVAVRLAASAAVVKMVASMTVMVGEDISVVAMVVEKATYFAIAAKEKRALTLF